MRLKLLATLLLVSTAMTPTYAHAGVIAAAVAFFTSVFGAFGVPALGFISSLALSGVSFALNSLFEPEAPAPTPQETQGNFMQEDAPRYWLSGYQRQGGVVSFADTKDGVIYKTVAHGDCELLDVTQYYLNDVAVSVNPLNNQVINSEYRVGAVPKYLISSRSGTYTQPANAVLRGAFPEWTVNHRGAGVCDTTMVVLPIADKDVRKLRSHRGVMGLGEPDFSVIGWFSRYYDPRNDSTNGGSGSERLNDRSTWGPSRGNAALVIVQHRIDIERFATDPADINWPNIIEQANICDEQITDRFGRTGPRYQIGVTINKKTERNIDAENRMLAACDAQRWVNDDGLWGIHVGKYDSNPDLVLTQSDIFEIESQDSEDGESLSTHYFAKYSEPSADMKGVDSGVYAHPDFDPSISDPKTAEIPLYAIHWHNQAIRVLQAGVLRRHEPLRVALVAGLRAKRAKEHRFVRIDMNDAKLDGVYEIDNIQDAQDPRYTQMVLIRCDEDRWNILAEDEPNLPGMDGIVQDNDFIENVDSNSMVISADGVSGEAGAAVRLTAVFPLLRDGVNIKIQHRLLGSPLWEDFFVDLDEGYGYSGTVPNGETQEVRWQTFTLSGRESGYSDIVTIDAIADTSPPSAVINGAVSFDIGSAVITWTTPADGNYGATRIYRATNSTVFGNAVLISTKFGFPSQSESYEDIASPNDYSYWLEPINKSNVAGPITGPLSGTIS